MGCCFGSPRSKRNREQQVLKKLSERYQVTPVTPDNLSISDTREPMRWEENVGALSWGKTRSEVKKELKKANFEGEDLELEVSKVLTKTLSRMKTERTQREGEGVQATRTQREREADEFLLHLAHPVTPSASELIAQKMLSAQKQKPVGTQVTDFSKEILAAALLNVSGKPSGESGKEPGSKWGAGKKKASKGTHLIKLNNLQDGDPPESTQNVSFLPTRMSSSTLLGSGKDRKTKGKEDDGKSAKTELGDSKLTGSGRKSKRGASSRKSKINSGGTPGIGNSLKRKLDSKKVGEAAGDVMASSEEDPGALTEV